MATWYILYKCYNMMHDRVYDIYLRKVLFMEILMLDHNIMSIDAGQGIFLLGKRTTYVVKKFIYDMIL